MRGRVLAGVAALCDRAEVEIRGGRGPAGGFFSSLSSWLMGKGKGGNRGGAGRGRGVGFLILRGARIFLCPKIDISVTVACLCPVSTRTWRE